MYLIKIFSICFALLVSTFALAKNENSKYKSADLCPQLSGYYKCTAGNSEENFFIDTKKANSEGYFSFNQDRIQIASGSQSWTHNFDDVEPGEYYILSEVYSVKCNSVTNSLVLRHAQENKIIHPRDDFRIGCHYTRSTEQVFSLSDEGALTLDVSNSTQYHKCSQFNSIGPQTTLPDLQARFTCTKIK